MESQFISWADRVRELFPDATVELPRGAAWCEDCKKTGIVRSYGGTLLQCNNCSGLGYIKPCTECGEYPQTRPWCTCAKCHEALNKKRAIERYEKAEKIPYDKYQGKFFSSDLSDQVMDKEEFEEMLSDMITEGYEDSIPKFVYVPNVECPINRDLYDLVDWMCEDGYEEMYEHLNTKSLEPINKAFEEWVESQGDSKNVYWDGDRAVVLIDELVKRLRQENARDEQ